MGAVQKLATVVIIGLVALATALTVYIAREPDRRDEELTEQQLISIERGTELYITYCLLCHGPAGLGVLGGEEPPRIGPPLASDYFRSDDPVDQAAAENLIRYRVTYGAPSDPRVDDKVMPAFGQDLSGEQIDDLVTLITHADWDYVYNRTVLQTGQMEAVAECEQDEGGEAADCDHIEENSIEAPPVYPTVPPADTQDPGDTVEDEADDVSEEGAAGNAETAAGNEVTLEAIDPFSWSLTEVIVSPGETIVAVNTGSLQHNFVVDEFDIIEDLPTDGSEVLITIPEDAEPGAYEFYCSVPGHYESGMFGTLIIEEAT